MSKGIEEKGYVYIFENENLPDLLKIGQTKNIENRLINANTWNPSNFECTYALKSEKYKNIENLAHWVFKKDKKAKEFFKVPLKEATVFLQKIVSLGIAEEVDTDLLEDYASKHMSDIPQSIKPVKIKKGLLKRSDNTTFKMLGIKPKSILTIKTDDGIIECRTIDDTNKVSYKNKEYAISDLATQLICKGPNSKASGFQHFIYEGKTLNKRRNDLFAKEASQELNFGDDED